MQIGKAIKQLRKKAGIKQYVLAEKIGFTQAHLSQIENEHKNPSTELLDIVAKYFEIPLPVFLWMCIEESDVAEDKVELFKMLKPAMDGLINSMF